MKNAQHKATPPKPKPQQAVKQPKKENITKSDEGYKPLLKQTEAKEEQKAVPKPQSQEMPAKPPVEEKVASDKESKQQTITHEQVDINQLKKYLAKLKRQFQSHIIYPKEAKERGYSGNPTISFSVDSDGNVNKSSIVIIKSSGYPLLDNNAIDAVMASVPFEKPYKPLNVSVQVSFSTK